MGSEATFIGVDVGGTHTDVVVARDGALTRGKALTTPRDRSIGVLDGIEVVAAELGLEVEQLLAETQRMVNGTTVVTNAVTEHRGSRVGAIVTRGFRDTFRIARGPRLNVSDDHLQRNPPSVVAWENVAEVTERVNHAGREIAPLAEDEVRAAARALVAEQGVEAVVIVFLWSFRNPAHELAAKRLVEAEHPEAYVVASSEVHPLSPEFERWNTALLTGFVRADVEVYVEGLRAKLAQRGLAPERLSLFSSLGGTLRPDEALAQPLRLMDSGPVGGVVAADSLPRDAGEKLICADMGGTSFDVAVLLPDREIPVSKRRALGHPTTITGLAAVDIVSIGAGGGSIAWLDARGVPQVGPQSAGADPGPIAYGRGGTEPTVTDAVVAMGLIAADAYLGGRIELDLEATRAGLAEFGAGHGWSAEEAAASIYRIALANMVNALRGVTVQRGQDPKGFSLLSYGGMTPMFACALAERMRIDRVLVPAHASTFSALGLVMADHVRRYERTVNWSIADADRLGEIEATARALVEEALADAAAAGFGAGEVELARTGAFRFQGQVWEIDMPLPEEPLAAADLEPLAERFVARYEEIYGQGTAWKGTPVTLLNYAVTATAREAKPSFERLDSGSAEPEPVAVRSVYEPLRRARLELPVFADAAVGPGAAVRGPAIVDALDSTIFLPEGFSARRDAVGTLEISAGGGR